MSLNNTIEALIYTKIYPKRPPATDWVDNYIHIPGLEDKRFGNQEYFSFFPAYNQDSSQAVVCYATTSTLSAAQFDPVSRSFNMIMCWYYYAPDCCYKHPQSVKLAGLYTLPKIKSNRQFDLVGLKLDGQENIQFFYPWIDERLPSGWNELDFDDLVPNQICLPTIPQVFMDGSEYIIECPKLGQGICPERLHVYLKSGNVLCSVHACWPDGLSSKTIYWPSGEWPILNRNGRLGISYLYNSFYGVCELCLDVNGGNDHFGLLRLGLKPGEDIQELERHNVPNGYIRSQQVLIL